MDRDRSGLPPPAPSLAWWVIAGVAAALLAAIAVIARWWTLGSAAAGWFYPYYQHFSARLVVIFLLVCASAMLMLCSRTLRDLDERTQLLFWWVFALAAMWALRSLTAYTLESLFTSNGASGFYGFAGEHSLGAVLRHFNSVRRGGPLHVQANMPGKLVLIYALELLTHNSRWLAASIAVVSSLGGFLIYTFVAELTANRRAALFAAILFWLYPARLFFLPIMNTVTPVIVLGCACLLSWWLRTGRTIPAILLGLALYGLVFFEPLPLAIGLVFTALVVRSIATGRTQPERWTLQACAMIASFVAASEAVRALTGFELIGAFRQTAAHAAAFNASAGRPYAYWIRGNLAELVFGLGPCTAVVFCGVAIGAVSRSRTVRARLEDPVAMLCASLIATIVIVEAIGINRGEVIRLWIFLGCFLAIPVACACAALPSRAAIGAVVSCALLQAAVGLALIAFVVP
jgi:hypothetical protein